RWRQQQRSPFRVLIPAWIVMWLGMGGLTARWREVSLYSVWWSWIPAAVLLGTGIFIYYLSGAHFSWSQLGGLPEVLPGYREQRLVTTGIRRRVRHPVYLGYLCEMLAWSLGTGLIVCWILTLFAVVTGAVMIRMEDAELEDRFGEEYACYRRQTPAIFPGLKGRSLG
ncbi:MAG TPA: isoprenylcysteine carboxylmethyltransferase family protein, partial [Candidatus Sulfotelmatobacter sp.]